MRGLQPDVFHREGTHIERDPLRRVAVTGVGGVSCLGSNVDSLWQGLLNGQSGIRRHQRFVEAGLPVTTGGEVDSVPQDSPERDIAIAVKAIQDAVRSSRIETQNAGFIWGTGLDTFQVDASGLVRRPAGETFATLARGFGTPRMMIATACATGTQAIGEAFRLVSSGKKTACVAGGSSIMLTPFYLMGFAGLQALAVDREDEDPATVCRPFDGRRRGFALADGAGALVLEDLESAQERGAFPLAEIVGFGMSQDAYDLNRPPTDGNGAELCMRRALWEACLPPDAIDAVNAHGTGTLVGDIAEAAALRRILGSRWKSTPVSSLKGAIGHAMAAAGALEAIVAVKTCQTGIVPPTVNLELPDEDCALDHVMHEPRSIAAERVLSVSFGMGGQNAAIVVQRFQP